LLCFCLYKVYKASSRHPPKVVILGAPAKATSGRPDNFGEDSEGTEGKVYDTNPSSDAKETYQSTVTILDCDEGKENTYTINVGSDVKELGLELTDGVVSKCGPGGYAYNCDVCVGNTLISANDVTDFSCSDSLKVMQSRPLKLVFSKPPIIVSL